MEGLESGGHEARGLAARRGKADPESSRIACTCAAGCSSAEIFLKERRLTGPRSGKSLEKSGAKTRCREKVRTRDGKERRSVGGGERGERERERPSARAREREKDEERSIEEEVYTEETGGRSVVREGSALGSWNVE